MRVCKKCNIDKSLNEFYSNVNTKDKLDKICKSCKISNTKKHIINFKLNNPNYSKQWYIENQVLIKDKSKKSYLNNKSKHNLRVKNYQLKNKDKIRIKDKEYKKKKLKDPIFKITHNLRLYLRRYLKSQKNVSSSILIGCSIPDLKLYLENQFKTEMTWENHGTVWEIDHIIPCSFFDLTKEKEQQRCYHYTNLQPLFKTTKIAESFGYTNEIGNRNKSNKQN